MRRIRQAEEDPYGLIVLNGDLMNTAVRSGVSDVYGEIMSPMQQIEHMVDLLRPVTDKIIGITSGNHENRVYKNDGIDTTRLVCRELGIEDRYAPEGVLIFLRFGTRNGHGRHKDKSEKQWYSIYATHGSGGGRKEGAKAIRLADMAAIVDADCYIHSHTHLPMIMKQAYHRTSPMNCSVTKVSKLFVNTGAALDYGGYGQSQEYKPASHETPIIHLEADHKRMSATL
jgi:predicted phosphodiesterase